MSRGARVYVLPVVQVFAAILLAISNWARLDRIQSPSWTKFDIQICHAVNEPVSTLMAVVGLATDRWLPNVTGIVVYWVGYFCMVWLLWYCVSLEARGAGQSVLTSKTRWRRTIDGLVVAYGAILLLMCGLLSLHSQAPARNMRMTAYFFWGVALVCFYGRDFWNSTRSKFDATCRRLNTELDKKERGG